MMFGQMHTIKARRIGQLNEAQALVKSLRQRPVRKFNMIKQPEFHSIPPIRTIVHDAELY
jgi:hypothetical protein